MRTDAVSASDEQTVREAPLQLGPDGHLVGILARPGGPAAVGEGPPRPAVLFLNAGVLHRVGPHRLHVILARKLAAQGVTSLRLDLSGIGDSRPVPGALSFRQSAVVDTCSAMDRLETDTDARRFVLFGLCSGADNALATATEDPRVVGLVLLDPPTYVTTLARARKLAARVRGLGTAGAVVAWGTSTLARRMRARLGTDTRPAQHADEEVSGGREMPPIADYRAQLGMLVDRGVAILSVFSGVLGERYNAPNQLFELFPELSGRVDVAYFPAANHTFTERDSQAALTSTVCSWIRRRR